MGFLGQFSAVDCVELRAQVGGTLTEIKFQDGQIVHKGDPLFVIDPRPFQIKLDQAVAQFQTAQAKRGADRGGALAGAAAQAVPSFGTAETVDQRAADQRSAQAAIDTAKAAIMDARLDLEFARVTAPFTGRIGAHLVSVGSLVERQPGRHEPDDAAGDDRLARSDLSRLRHERVRLPGLSASPSAAPRRTTMSPSAWTATGISTATARSTSSTMR